MIASACLARSRHAPSWSSITAGATYRALMCTEQIGTWLIHTDSPRMLLDGPVLTALCLLQGTGRAGDNNPGRTVLLQRPTIRMTGWSAAVSSATRPRLRISEAGAVSRVAP